MRTPLIGVLAQENLAYMPDGMPETRLVYAKETSLNVAPESIVYSDDLDFTTIIQACVFPSHVYHSGGISNVTSLIR